MGSQPGKLRPGAIREKYLNIHPTRKYFDQQWCH